MLEGRRHNEAGHTSLRRAFLVPRHPIKGGLFQEVGEGKEAERNISSTRVQSCFPEERMIAIPTKFPWESIRDGHVFVGAIFGNLCESNRLYQGFGTGRPHSDISRNTFVFPFISHLEPSLSP